MAHYMVRLWLEGPIGTRMISGTLFGHLCWAYRWRHGERALKKWLAEMEADPLLVSDGLPRGYLPRPILPVRMRRTEEPPEFSYKELKRRQWLSREQFLRTRDRLNEETLLEALLADEKAREEERKRLRKSEEEIPPGVMKSCLVAHNRIDRVTGRTPLEGGLYFMEEDWPSSAAREREVYVGTSVPAHELKELFELVGKWGFGRDASLGRGQFTVLAVDRAPEGLFDGQGTHRMSLSHGSMTANMADCRYRLHTHFGKVGGLYATKARPFKKPVTLLVPGSTFRPLDEGPFGELLRGVYSENQDVVHSAWHLTVPYTEAH